jgi:membrane-associated phospholipid phosphatase
MPPLYAHDPFLQIQAALSYRWLDVPMAVATISCEGWAIALIAAAYIYSRERRLDRGLRVAVPLVASLLLAGLVAQVLKHAVDVPRPLAVLGPAVHVLLEPLRGRSFPSGHAASAAALATFAAWRYGLRAWPLGLLALVGGLSRIYVGAHWALDVAAGWTVGAGSALVAEVAARAFRARLQRLGGAAPAID